MLADEGDVHLPMMKYDEGSNHCISECYLSFMQEILAIRSRYGLSDSEMQFSMLCILVNSD